jgi:hypothetical protein
VQCANWFLQTVWHGCRHNNRLLLLLLLLLLLFSIGLMAEALSQGVLTTCTCHA